MNAKIDQVECSPKDGCHLLIEFKQYVNNAISKMITRRGLWSGVFTIIGTIFVAAVALFYFFDGMRMSAKDMPDIKAKVDTMWVETRDVTMRRNQVQLNKEKNIEQDANYKNLEQAVSKLDESVKETQELIIDLASKQNIKLHRRNK